MTVCLGLSQTTSAQSPGSLDLTFNVGRGADYYVNSVAVQADGKFILGGSFTHIGAVTRAYLARLNTDGSLDTSFNPNGNLVDNSISSLVIQTDGKILIAGYFTKVGGIACGRLARLNTDGTLDPSFNPGADGANDHIGSVAPQVDGKLVISGYFTTFNGMARGGVARLNADGSVDTDFDPGRAGAISFGGMPTPYVNVATPQGDGKIIVGGAFSRVGTSLYGGIVRLNADGSLDQGFNPGGSGAASSFGFSGVNCVTIQSDGKLLIGGSFNTFNKVARPNLARLTVSGGLDTTFNPGLGANGSVYSLAFQADGKLLVGGAFVAVVNNTYLSNNIARLNTDGSADRSFAAGSGFSNTVSTVVLQSNGKIVVGGGFINFNSIARDRAARLNADGSLDTAFNAGGGLNNIVNSVAIQPNGKTIVGGNFSNVDGIYSSHVARLNADGTLDAAFNHNGINDTVNSVAVQADGKVLVGGLFMNAGYPPRNYLARLNVEGGIDNAFNLDSVPGGYVNSVAVQGDGKILLAGAFYYVGNGVGRARVARLNANGSLDASFVPASVVDSEIAVIAAQADGKVLIAGGFTSVGNVARGGIARLNANGSLDTAFNAGEGAKGTVNCVTIQSDGKILIGGSFTSFNGTARSYLTRLNADGSLDAAFTPAGLAGPVLSVVLQGDGKILVGKDFAVNATTTYSRVTRLNADGSLDTVFNPGDGPDGTVKAMGLQTDGKIVIGGTFQSVDRAGVSYVARLFGDTMAPAAPSVVGSLADTFQPTSAMVHSYVNPQSSATVVSFQYGLTTDYGSTTAAQSVGDGTSPVAASAALSGLSPSPLYHYRAVATNDVGTTYGADATFITLNPAQIWRQQHFGTTDNTGDAADAADPDGDGIPNLLERALGLDPRAAGTIGLPVVGRDISSHRLTLTVARGPDTSDLILTAEGSSDLINWTTTNVGFQQYTSTTFQAIDFDYSGSKRRFLRLRVTAP